MPKPLFLPKSMRPPTLESRREYYSDEFPLERVKKWFLSRKVRHPTFAIDVGADSGIFDARHKHLLNKLVYISKYKNWAQLRQKLIDYAPEDVYYSRNISGSKSACEKCENRSFGCFNCSHFLGQELVFDIDPENIGCKKCKKLERKKSIYSFCEHSFLAAEDEAARLPIFLKGRFGFRKIQAAYSGRGFHIHVFDRNTLSYSKNTRQSIAKIVMKAGFHIDEWVTAGSIDLVRLPYSLHGLVGRVPVLLRQSEIKNFDPFRDPRAVPNFLKSRR